MSLITLSLAGKNVPNPFPWNVWSKKSRNLIKKCLQFSFSGWYLDYSLHGFVEGNVQPPRYCLEREKVVAHRPKEE